MSARGVKNWVGILAGKSPHEAARFILSDLGGYPMSNTRTHDFHHSNDVEQLANALLAWEIVQGDEG